MDMIAAYSEAVRRNTDRISVLGRGQLELATPCREWDVRALLAHMIGGQRMFAAAMGSPTDGGEDLPTDVEGLTLAYRAAGAAAAHAFGAPDAAERLASLPLGAVPGAMAVALALTDSVVHGWDLAVATGQDASIDDGLAEALLAGARGSVTDALRAPDGVMPVFAAPVAVPGDAPAADRLVAFLGRDPGAPLSR